MEYTGCNDWYMTYLRQQYKDVFDNWNMCNNKEKENDNMNSYVCDKIKEVEVTDNKGNTLLKAYKVETPLVLTSAIVEDLSVYNDKVTCMTFTDGEVHKAICDDTDEFDLENAINVCLLKYQCGGSANYHRIVDAIKKQYYKKTGRTEKRNRTQRTY